MLVREFESRCGEILKLFAKIKKDQLLRAPSASKNSSTRVDEGRKSWNLLAIKMQGTNRCGMGWRRACYVTPDLSYDKEGERKRRANIINGMGKKKSMKRKGKRLFPASNRMKETNVSQNGEKKTKNEHHKEQRK